MATGIRSDHRSSKELSFPEWFAKSPGSRIDIYRVFTQRAERERLRAKNPASFVYTINPQDGLVKKSGKIALKTLSYLTIIPIISVKAIDFFKGERRTIESDFQAKLEEMKSKIKKDQEGGIDLILISAPVSAPLKKTKSGSKSGTKSGSVETLSSGRKKLPTSNEELGHLYEKALAFFKGNERKAAEFLSVLGEGAGVILGQELVKDPKIQKILTPKGSDKGVEKPSDSGKAALKKDRVHIKLDEKTQTVDAAFDLGRLVSKMGHKLEKQVSGVGRACFDFRREQVILNWEVKVDWEVKPHHRQKSLAPIPEENQNYIYAG